MNIDMTNLSEPLRVSLSLQRASAALSRHYDGKLGTLHGLSFGDFAVLLRLAAAPDGQLRRVDLAEQMGLTASAVTRMLIPMEKIGLVTRQPDPRDARVGYAALTKAGERTLKEALESAEDISQDLFGEQPAAQLRTVGAVLGRL
jgi:DNA-binding MarR family transcriptional regulator